MTIDQLAAELSRRKWTIRAFARPNGLWAAHLERNGGTSGNSGSGPSEHDARVSAYTWACDIEAKAIAAIVFPKDTPDWWEEARSL